MPWPPSGPATAVAGSVLTAAWLNTNMRDSLLELRLGGIAMTNQQGGHMIAASSSTQFVVLDGPSTTGNFRDAVLQRPELKDYAETVVDVAISAGTLTLNLELGNVFRVTLNQNITTLTIQNPSANGKRCSFMLITIGDGTPRTIAWGSAVKWADNAPPTPTSGIGVEDEHLFGTMTAGTRWNAVVKSQGHPA